MDRRPVTTPDNKQEHYPYPCVPHDPAVPCQIAQAAAAQGKTVRILRPQESRLRNG